MSNEQKKVTKKKKLIFVLKIIFFIPLFFSILTDYLSSTLDEFQYAYYFFIFNYTDLLLKEVGFFIYAHYLKLCNLTKTVVGVVCLKTIVILIWVIMGYCEVDLVKILNVLNPLTISMIVYTFIKNITDRGN